MRNNLIERIFWFIRLRWIAVASLISVVFIVERIIGIPLTSFRLYVIAALLGIYNFISFIYLRQIDKDKSANKNEIGTRVANIQISLDLLILAVLIHFSGGIENPFIFYFIFHMIIASILLPRRTSFMQATFAAFLFCSVVTLEYRGTLPHYPLPGFINYAMYNNLLYVTGTSFVFISTLYIAVYMATSISVRLREREKSLREANQLLSEQDQAKSEYVLRVSHDIKEHLAAVESCIDPVTKGFTGSLNDKQRDLLERASERTAKLLFFVKSLLEISRIKLSRYMEMAYFSIKDTAKAAINYVDKRAKDKGVTLVARFDPLVGKIKGVRPYVEETISNLLANSVKYTPKGGTISLEITDKGESVLIHVKDTGIGIPKEALPKVFDEFYRADNAKEIEKDGTGLGLSIAKQVVERHNGKIRVESEEGKGTSFFIILPK